MNMKVLLTGAFGNIGESALLALFEEDYDIVCFDLKTSKNEKKVEKLLEQGQFSVVWGDITNSDDVKSAISEVGCILHVAGIIPPKSEMNADLTHRVNVEGTRNLIKGAEELELKPKFIFTSSISVHGPRMTKPPPCRADEPYNPTDNYTHSKVACEKLLKESQLPWTIFRLGASPPLASMGMGDPGTVEMLFDMPLDQRVEFIHTRDVGIALRNAIQADTLQKVLLIGGGKGCQMLNREFMKETLNAYGMSLPSDLAFKIPKNEDDWFYTDWMDTQESQALLHFQNTSFEEYIVQLKKKVGLKRYFFKLISPIIRYYLKRKSPYYKENKRNYKSKI